MGLSSPSNIGLGGIYWDRVRRRGRRLLGRFEEVAAGLLYLASDQSAFMTGAEFVLDGGITAM